MTLTPTQKRALEKLVLATPDGLVYDDDETEPRATFDSLVRNGMAIRVEIAGQRRYQLTTELAAAFAISVARANAETAALN